jgi:hypothetical protein
MERNQMENITMKAIDLVGNIDDQHQLKANVPAELPTGPVRLIVFVPEEQDAGSAWTRAIGREWADELADFREDIYTLDDGQPVNLAG